MRFRTAVCLYMISGCTGAGDSAAEDRGICPPYSGIDPTSTRTWSYAGEIRSAPATDEVSIAPVDGSSDEFARESLLTVVDDDATITTLTSEQLRCDDEGLALLSSTAIETTVNAETGAETSETTDTTFEPPARLLIWDIEYGDGWLYYHYTYEYRYLEVEKEEPLHTELGTYSTLLLEMSAGYITTWRNEDVGVIRYDIGNPGAGDMWLVGTSF